MASSKVRTAREIPVESLDQLASLVKLRQTLKDQIAQAAAPYEAEMQRQREAFAREQAELIAEQQQVDQLLQTIRGEVETEYLDAEREYWEKLLRGEEATLPEMPVWLRPVHRKSLEIEDESLIPDEHWVSKPDYANLKKLDEAVPGTKFVAVTTFSLYPDRIP